MSVIALEPSTTASPVQLVVFAVLGLIPVLTWKAAWSGRLDAGLERGLRPLWPYGEHSRRGFLRTGPMSLAVLFIVSVMAVLHAPLIVDHAPTVAVTAEWFGALAALMVIPLDITIIAFNRPRLIVAPHRRGEPGAVAAWRAERRERERRETT